MPGSMQEIKYYFPGIALIILAVMIFTFPEVLVALVTAMVIMFGIGALYIGHQIRRSRGVFRMGDERFMDDNSSDSRG